MKVGSMKPVRIIIFAKAPLPGFAKTRLIPELGAEGAAELALQMLLHTLQEAIAANIGSVELCVTPSISDTAWHGIQLPKGIQITDQGEGDLGERMGRAARCGIEQGESVILIGTDCVEMSAALLQDAKLNMHKHDAVIHCTVDGGYALLGMNQFNSFLLSRMPWSTDEVASTTLGRIGQLGWSVHVGQMLHDVDEASDLKYLPGYLSGHWRLRDAA
ncbi:MAG: TIGR04282 family arsenosugar biosynthesis glycosyltransferase [Gallionella sp.]